MTTAHSIDVDLSRVRKSSPKDYAVRFGFGGLITVAAGIMTKSFGPAVGGLFLAFPAILPASLTLIEKHDSEVAAGIDALGAAMGCIGLAAFGLVIWLGAHRLPAPVALILAMIVWLLVSIAIWYAYYRLRRRQHDKEQREENQTRLSEKPAGQG